MIPPMLADTITAECPGCGALDGEPCTYWCDDAWGGIVRDKHYRSRWDDEN